MNQTNEQIFDATTNLYEFWQRGGTWSADKYIKYLLVWEKNQEFKEEK